MVEMPPLGDVLKALEEDALAPSEGSVAGRSLPLLFIRSCDGVGYHSGRTITCENVFGTDTGWMSNNGTIPIESYTLRVM